MVEQGVWAVKDADLSTVADFYQTAAEKAGLKVFRSTDREGIVDRVFVADGRDLLIRTKRSGAQVLLIMRYRYTM